MKCISNMKVILKNTLYNVYWNNDTSCCEPSQYHIFHTT